MAITRANVENVLVHRAGALMTKAGMDGATVDGTNTDLADPIAYGLRQAGYDVDDFTSPTDAEIDDAADDIDQVVDLAELRVLENILGNLDDVDTTLGPRTERLSQLASQVEKKLDRLQTKCQKLYGYGAATITADVFVHDIAEHYDGTEESL